MCRSRRRAGRQIESGFRFGYNGIIRWWLRCRPSDGQLDAVNKVAITLVLFATCGVDRSIRGVERADPIDRR
jgi:hypothetical protein